jgi:hypothetical protein
LISICTNYFVASSEALVTKRKSVGVLIEVIGIADLFKFVRHFHPVSLRFYGPEASVRLPVSLPFFRGFQDTSGHCVTLTDTKNQRVY